MDSVCEKQTNGLVSSIVASLGVCPTTVSHWKKKYANSPDVFPLETFETVIDCNLESILHWNTFLHGVDNAQKKKIYLSGQVLQAKAKEVYRFLPAHLKPNESNNFFASNGWLNRFKK
ncbi:hypothetical protein HK096_008480 [Nowakowskiella sp. JEL0078]|nr:hypothetical protein HK096_008480 [Nowakowskiella sp. JEL0078]